MMTMEFLTVKEVSELLKLKETTIREYLRHGKLIGAQFGREWRITKEDLETFIKEKTKTK